MSFGVQKAECKVPNQNRNARSAAADLCVFPQKLKAYRTILSDARDVPLRSTKPPLFEWLLPHPPHEPTKGPLRQGAGGGLDPDTANRRRE